MMLNNLMAEKSMSKYRLAKTSGVPYTTINDICNQKAKMEKCPAETIYKIAKALDVSIETLMEPHFVKRCSFDIFTLKAKFIMSSKVTLNLYFSCRGHCDY